MSEIFNADIELSFTRKSYTISAVIDLEKVFKPIKGSVDEIIKFFPFHINESNNKDVSDRKIKIC
jgi:hypothetical protein